MHDGRHFRILFHLLKNDRVTAPELAKEFEVSVRTIYRDIDTMSAAGIPVYMQGGRNGGIYLSEGYRLDKVSLSDTEQAEILLALQGLGAVQYPGIDAILLKLGALFTDKDRDWIEVDLTRWGTAETIERDKALFSVLRKAITSQRRIRFDYYNAKGEVSARTIEPTKLVYRDRAWYLTGYCLMKSQPRVFRLSRMKHTELTEDSFEHSPDKEAPIFPLDGDYGPLLDVKLVFNASVAYRLYDAFEDDVMERVDDTIQVEMKLPESDWLYSFLMSFGGHVKILEPVSLKENLRKRLLSALAQTEENWRI